MKDTEKKELIAKFQGWLRTKVEIVEKCDAHKIELAKKIPLELRKKHSKIARNLKKHAGRKCEAIYIGNDLIAYLVI